MENRKKALAWWNGLPYEVRATMLIHFECYGENRESYPAVNSERDLTTLTGREIEVVFEWDQVRRKRAKIEKAAPEMYELLEKVSRLDEIGSDLVLINCACKAASEAFELLNKINNNGK